RQRREGRVHQCRGRRSLRHHRAGHGHLPRRGRRERRHHHRIHRGVKMMRWITLVMLIALAPVVLHAQTEDYRFKGKIVDTAGKPVGGVRVTFKDVSNGAKITFTSEKDGSFDRRMIPSGQYNVTFEKDGYATRTEKFDWSASQAETKTIEAQVVLETK